MNFHARITTLAFAAALTLAAPQLCAQQGQAPAAPQGNAFQAAANDIQQRLAASLAELSTLRAQVGDEQVAMNQELRDLEDKLLELRTSYQTVTRLLDSRTLDLGNLRTELEQRHTQANYLSTLFGEYGNEVGSRLHIAELQRYGQQLDEARLALENTTMSEGERFDVQLGVVETSIGQLEEALGGTRFEGRAVADGLVKQGTFVLIGPSALFRSADGQTIGAAEERTGSQEPTVIVYTDPEDRMAAAALATGSGGAFPLDTTLGNAQKVEAIQETWLEHLEKGGPILYPMGVLAASALLVVLLKWLGMLFVRRPAKRDVKLLLDLVDGSDYASAVEHSAGMAGPSGRMLNAGARHLGEPRDLVEEVMFEQVLTERLKLQSWLPFVAICATSAPLLGLLGTVTGIMNTFALMTEFGTGDPKVLSSGISEALITTEYGLIIAIPSLLLHAFLSRKAKGIVDHMEKSAVQFMNHVRTPEPIEHRDAVEIA
ncbi:MAG: MotA/TolQ/ExbB proton channel family protein [Planctomycetota bacterium]